jgi:hypothetical protein
MIALSRRSLLLGSAVFAALPTAPSFSQITGTGPPPQLHFSTVTVDVDHLRRIGAGPFADIVQAAMTDELRRVFADRIGGRGPRLIVRVTTLFLVMLPESGGRWHDRGTSTDSIDGEALIVGRRGEVLARYPQYAALVPTATWYDPLNEQKRAVAVARFYAQWLRSKIS